MGCIPFEAVFSEMALYASSQAWQLGRAVSRAVNTHDSIVSNILEQQQGMVLITGTVRKYCTAKINFTSFWAQ